MKIRNKLTVMVIIMLLASTYAVASGWMPEKYDLDGQLSRVSSIPNTHYIGWGKIDNQSLILQTSPSRYYLVVLSWPAFNLPFTEDIGITGMNLMTRPGYDNVVVRQATGRWEKFIINRIYKFENKNQVWQVIAQLTGTQPIERERKDSSGETLLAAIPISVFRRF